MNPHPNPTRRHFLGTLGASVAAGVLPARAAILAALGNKSAALPLLSEADESGPRIDLYHFMPIALYDILHGYPPFDALIKAIR